MGIKECSLCALQSRGDKSRIVEQGPITSTPAMKQMLNVLEGGPLEFEKKLKIYETFLDRLSGVVRDMDMSAIEGHFRRQTIDSLRQFLQPLISARDILNRELVDFARHQARHFNPDYIVESLEEVRGLLAVVEQTQPTLSKLLIGLNSTIDRINTHTLGIMTAVDELRLLDTNPVDEVCDLFEYFSAYTNDTERILEAEGRRVSFGIDERLKGTEVLFDPGHLKLVVRNLYQNSLVATERQAILMDDLDLFYAGKIELALEEEDEESVSLVLNDNGAGMPDVVSSKLYLQRVTTGRGADRGMGGVIISKLLEVNGGEINVLSSQHGTGVTGTSQRIKLRSAKKRS
jgi:signal transduction histidine kinase